MGTPITEYVSVSVSVSDRLIQETGFGTPLIFHLATLPSGWVTGQRTKEYISAADVAVDFSALTKAYAAAAAIFAGTRAPVSLKVGLALAADANIAASLDAIEAYDPDWYGLVSTYKAEADLNAIALWVESTKHICGLSSEDAGVIVAATTTDIASDLKGFAYNRTFYNWHHQAGLDISSGLTVSVASLVATWTKTAHGLRAGDICVMAGATPSQLNGINVVLTVPTADTFTSATTAVDGAGSGTITAFCRYKFPEARWMGKMLPSTPGAETWAFKSLEGQEPVPVLLLPLTAQKAARGKNANIYTTIGGQGATQEGKMASGRFIDTQVGVDWIGTRLQEAIMNRLINSVKVPYTDAGLAILRADIASVLQTGRENGLLGLLVGSTSGQFWIIDIPSVADQTDADRIARKVSGVEITVRFAGAIHNVVMDVAVGL